MMAAYLAMRIEAGKLDYKSVFSQTRFSQYKDDVDLILVADGKQDLIVAL